MGPEGLGHIDGGGRSLLAVLINSKVGKGIDKGVGVIEGAPVYEVGARSDLAGGGGPRSRVSPVGGASCPCHWVLGEMPAKVTIDVPQCGAVLSCRDGEGRMARKGKVFLGQLSTDCCGAQEGDPVDKLPDRP